MIVSLDSTLKAERRIGGGFCMLVKALGEDSSVRMVRRLLRIVVYT